jgi:ATPase subunit of ABC transporter with duplicated ATPase domains
MSVIETYDLEINKPSFIIGTKWILKNLTPITVIFGKNGSGKSILLRSIRDRDPVLHHYCVPERGGNLSYEPGMMQQESEGNTRMAGSKNNLSGDYRSRVITRIGAYLTKRGSSRENVNVNDLEEMEEIIDEVLIDFRFNIQSGYPPYTLTRSETDQKIDNIQQLSSGEAQLFTLSLDLILACEMWKLDKKIGYLLVDEPDPTDEPANIECDTEASCVSGHIPESNTVTVILILLIAGIILSIVLAVCISYKGK